MLRYSDIKTHLNVLVSSVGCCQITVQANWKAVTEGKQENNTWSSITFLNNSESKKCQKEKKNFTLSENKNITNLKVYDSMRAPRNMFISKNRKYTV